MEVIEINNIEVDGSNLTSNSLEEIIKSESNVIMHFLRHLGCSFCRKNVENIRELIDKHPNFPKIVFVHQSSVEDGNKYFEKYLPGASHISNPDKTLYDIFKVNKLKSSTFFNPIFLRNLLKLTWAGYSNKLKKGDDPTLLTGTFLYFKGLLKWVHRAKFPGEEPSWNSILKK